MAEPFRGLTLRRHSNLWQALLAKLQQDLEDGPECTKLNDRITNLTEKIRTTSLDKHRQELEELDMWQRRLPKERKPGFAEEDDHTLSHHGTLFDRVAHLMPERRRLASLLPLPVPLRSPEGRQALKDMIAICRQKNSVPDHPALKANNDCCPVAKCSILLDGQSTKSASEGWNHIYRCLKRSLQKQHGFGALCFICHRRITDKIEFEQHCQYYLDHPQTIPLQYGFLEFRGMLASPGYCPGCLQDTTKPASDRMKPFLNT
ncbi:hypothetical protein AJ80_01087 [Polytolypa hystricis UAMH7299]|uniref:Uncharacterized protein n=1 Tax=Polytolypa hystricis (strain UAMH7299) TaxID=1447883 RepID=A0A2B7Z1C4_POLH7|nr:hypothetical protein AJ80_01087 [Polytolypa hystricis UAMH7299]